MTEQLQLATPLTEGEFISVLGPQGVGKTVFSKLLKLLFHRHFVFVDTSGVIKHRMNRRGNDKLTKALKERAAVMGKGDLMPTDLVIPCTIEHLNHQVASRRPGNTHGSVSVGSIRDLDQLFRYREAGVNGSLKVVHLKGTFEQAMKGVRHRVGIGVARPDDADEATQLNRWDVYINKTVPVTQEVSRTHPTGYREIDGSLPLRQKVLDFINFLEETTSLSPLKGACAGARQRVEQGKTNDEFTQAIAYYERREHMETNEHEKWHHFFELEPLIT